MKILSKDTQSRTTSQSIRLGAILALVGGFLDAYTYICRGGVFANAETGNIVLVGIGIANKDFLKALMALLPIIAFSLGVFFVEYIRDKDTISSFLEFEQGILIVEMIVLFIVGFIPTTVSHSIIASIISFVSSLQMQAFRKLVDSPYSTTMCTGNLRSATELTYKYIKNKESYNGIKSIRYWIIIFFFVLGAAIGGTLTKLYEEKSVWVCVMILLCGTILFSINKREISEEEESNLII